VEISGGRGDPRDPQNGRSKGLRVALSLASTFLRRCVSLSPTLPPSSLLFSAAACFATAARRPLPPSDIPQVRRSAAALNYCLCVRGFARSPKPCMDGAAHCEGRRLRRSGDLLCVCCGPDCCEFLYSVFTRGFFSASSLFF
jgi:hypothetical protein